MNTAKMMVAIHEEDGKPIARILKPDDPPLAGEVHSTVLPFPENPIRVGFYEMSKERAEFYANEHPALIMMLIAQASNSMAKETEQWYALRIQFRSRALLHPNKFTKAISRAVVKSGLGWLNHIILTEPNNYFLLDVALSDEAKGREVIGDVMRSWGIEQWDLILKSDGIVPDGSE